MAKGDGTGDTGGAKSLPRLPLPGRSQPQPGQRSAQQNQAANSAHQQGSMVFSKRRQPAAPHGGNEQPEPMGDRIQQQELSYLNQGLTKIMGGDLSSSDMMMLVLSRKSEEEKARNVISMGLKEKAGSRDPIERDELHI
jgi:hypothetical protein